MTTEDKMVKQKSVIQWVFEQTLGDSEGQGSLVCCSSWGHRVRNELATHKIR